MGLGEERDDQNFIWSSESISWLLQHSSGLVLMVGSSRVTGTERLCVSLVGAITTFPYITLPATSNHLGVFSLGWWIVSQHWPAVTPSPTSSYVKIMYIFELGRGGSGGGEHGAAWVRNRHIQ